MDNLNLALRFDFRLEAIFATNDKRPPKDAARVLQSDREFINSLYLYRSLIKSLIQLVEYGQLNQLKSSPIQVFLKVEAISADFQHQTSPYFCITGLEKI